MGSSSDDVIKAIQHYQERLERYNLSKSEDKMQYVIKKLSKLPIKTSHLETTGIGRTVNALKKLNGKVGEAAKDLVTLWKDMVLQEEKAAQEESMETEKDACSTYSSEEETTDYHREEGKENVNNNSETDESDSEVDNSEEDSESHSYLESKSSKYKNDSKHNNKRNHSTNSSSSEEEVSKKHHKSNSRKRDRSSESSSEERMKHKSKKNKVDVENWKNEKKIKDKDQSVKAEKERKHEKKDRHSSTTRSNDDKSESRHKSKSNSEATHHNSEKYNRDKEKTEKDKDKKSSHSSSKHHSSSSHSSSSKKESNDKEKDKHKSKRESSSSKSPEKKSKESNSSSSSSNRSKEEKGKKKSKDSHSSSPSKDKTSHNESSVKREKEKKKSNSTVSKEKIINGIDSESGASFAEALGMCGPTVSSHSSKKKSSYDKTRIKSVENKKTDISTNSKPKSESNSHSSTKVIPDLLAEEPPEPLNICLSSLLPEITPNYKPTPLLLDSQFKRVFNDDEALSRVMSNKNQRTKVYSGNKTVGKVESLFTSCIRVLQDNIDALEYTGGVPYHILKPILERATPDQLFNMEHHNPYLIDDTDELWQLHCQKDFRTKKRQELESWREMYMRCLDEREAKLNFITANIKQAQDKSEPVRTTKLAYIDSGFVKPPRNIARKQAKNGTVTTDRKVPTSQKLAALAKSGDAEKVAVPNPGSRAAERSSNSSSSAIKPKKAPLMAKTLSFFKNRFKR